MNILDGLLGEHAAMLTLFQHLEQSATRMDLERLHEAGLLLERVVTAHSIGEDRFLFDAATEAAPQATAGLREVLHAMHAEHMQLALELDKLRGTDNEAAARGCLQRVIEVAREHFEVEERVLFQAAGSQIGREKLDELGAAWKRFRMKEALT